MIQFGRAELHHRAFGSGRQSLEPARELPISRVLDRDRFAVELRDSLPHARHRPTRCSRCGAVCARVRPAPDTSRARRHRRRTPERSNISVVIATCHPWFFSPTRFFFGTRTSSKKTSLKPRVAGHLHQRPNGHAGAVHVDQQIADALVLGRVGIGAHQQENQVGKLRVRGPDLLPVDDEVVALFDRAGLQRGEVRTRARFADSPGTRFPRTSRIFGR